MKTSLFLLIGFLSLVLQSTLFHDWPSQSVRFDVPFLLLLYLAIHGESTESGLWTVLILGLMSDILGARFLGESTVLYALIYLVFRVVRQHLFLDSTALILLAVGVLSLLKELIQWGISTWIGVGSLAIVSHFGSLILQVFWNLLVSLVLFKLLEWILPPPRRQGVF